MSRKPRLGPLVAAFFRHGSNTPMAVCLVALVAWLLLNAPQPVLLAWAALGVCMFPFYEYVFHRFVLHTPPARSRVLVWFQRQVHADHHEDNHRLDRLFTPLWAFPPLVIGQLALYLALGLPLPVAFALLFGNLAGFLYYEWVHYIAHVPYVPKTAWGRRMKAHHLRHHHKHERYWFGVTTPFVDKLFRTDPPLEAVAQSPTARQIHGDDRAGG